MRLRENGMLDGGSSLPMKYGDSNPNKLPDISANHHAHRIDGIYVLWSLRTPYFCTKKEHHNAHGGTCIPCSIQEARDEAMGLFYVETPGRECGIKKWGEE